MGGYGLPGRSESNWKFRNQVGKKIWRNPEFDKKGITVKKWLSLKDWFGLEWLRMDQIRWAWIGSNQYSLDQVTATSREVPKNYC